MITINDAIRIDLDAQEVKKIIEKALEKINIAKLDNLRNRHKNIQFDCLLRGYIGEYCISKWLKLYDINFDTNNYIQDGDNIDIDFLYKQKNIELKTSLVPDFDLTIDNAIKKRDLKLIRRGDTKIEDLRGDVHLQIYYDQRRKAKDDWLQLQEIDLDSADTDYLYDAFKAHAYEKTTYFVGWLDKETIAEQINLLPEKYKYWSFSGSQRVFWNCKIHHSKSPIELIDYLWNL